MNISMEFYLSGGANRWFDVCSRLATRADEPAWYTGDKDCTIYEDYTRCLADAQAGVPRAQQYIARHTQLRMTEK